MRRDLAALRDIAMRWQRPVGDQPLTPQATEEKAKAARGSKENRAAKEHRRS